MKPEQRCQPIELILSDVDGIIRQGFEHKLPTIREIMTQLKLSPEQVCYIGDDLADLAAIQTVGLGVAVADAVAEVRSSAHFVTKVPGGCGAVRETIEFILKAKQRWGDLILKYHA